MEHCTLEFIMPVYSNDFELMTIFTTLLILIMGLSMVNSNNHFMIVLILHLFSSPGPKGHGELLPYQCVQRHASCGVRRLSTLENKYSNIFFSKTTGPTVLKFHMEHDLTPGSQNCKIGQVEYPRWPLLLKIAKTTKSTSSPKPLDIFG